jgi:hypothetical protein
MAFKMEVQTDSTGKWASNAIVLATEDEARAYGNDLAGRWLAVRGVRVVEVDATPNYTFNGGKLEPIPENPG